MFDYAESILLRHSGMDHVLMGDLNIDIAQSSKSPYKAGLIVFCGANNLSVKVDDFSRVAHRKWRDGATTTTRTMIDVILCHPAGNYTAAPPTDVGVSDHRLIKTVSHYRCSVPSHKTITVINWKKGNQQQLKADIRHITRQYVPFQPSPEPQKALSSLIGQLFTAITNNYPKHIIRVSRKDPPWISGHVKTLTGRRDAAYKRWKASGQSNQHDRTVYQQLKRDVKRAISTAKQAWFVQNKNNAKKI